MLNLLIKIVMFILFFQIRVHSIIIINPYGPTVVGDFTNCISDLMDTNFKDSGLLIFANTNNVSTSVARIRMELLKKINEHVKFSVQVMSPKNEPAICVQHDDEGELSVVHMDQFEAIPIADYFILVVDTYKDFARVASRLVRSRSWNPNAKFVILLFNFVSDDMINVRIIENILTCLFRRNVINSVVVVPQANNIRNAIVYSWRPYHPPKDCGDFNATAKNKLLVENTCERGKVKLKIDIFKDRIPSDMKGCTMHILAIQRQPYVSENSEDPNIERRYINELAKIYNFTTKYEIHNGFRGERDNMGNWDGALKDLANKKGQLLLGGIFPDFDVHEDFECSSSYLADSYTWVVPRATNAPPWVALIIIFKDLVWYSVIAGFIICGITWKVLGQLSDDSLYHTTFKHCFLNTWISLLGFVAYARPVKQSLRVFFVFFNLFCILLLTGYQTKLIDVLTNPTTNEQVDTMEELVVSGLKFGGFEDLHDLFYNSSDPFDYFLGEQWIDVDNITSALLDVVVHRNFSLLCSRLELAHLSTIIPELSDSSGNFRYFAFDINMFSVPMEMVALRGFPFMRNFSETLGLFKQLGANVGVRRYFAALNSRRRANLLRSLDKPLSDVNPLSVQHLQGGFLALALGFVGGTLVLFCEIIINSQYFKNKIKECRKRFKKWKNKTQY